MKIILRILITAFALILVANFVPGIEVANFYVALIAALILGVLNTLVRPVLLILTLPITIVTLGLFIFIINAGLFLFAASFLEGFSVDGWVAAIIGSILVSIVSAIGNSLIGD